MHRLTEGALQDAIRLALADVPGLLLHRNNCGIAEHWTGRTVQRVVYGLAPGSADLVGLLNGRFVALEIKSATGRVAPAQAQWLALVRRYGGFAAVVRSVPEALAAVERARGGACE